MDALEQGQHLVADQPAHRSRIARVSPPGEPALAAVGLGLLAPEAKKRTYDAVLATDFDPLGSAARDEAKEDRLDLVGEGVAGRTKRIGAKRIADIAQLRLGRAARGGLDDLGAEVRLAP